MRILTPEGVLTMGTIKGRDAFHVLHMIPIEQMQSKAPECGALHTLRELAAAAHDVVKRMECGAFPRSRLHCSNRDDVEVVSAIPLQSCHRSVIAHAYRIINLRGNLVLIL